LVWEPGVHRWLGSRAPRERIEPSTAGGVRPLKLAVRATAEIPIYLAALGPRSTRLCGELADGWSPFLLPVSGLRSGIDLVEAGARSAGRPRPLVCPSIPAAVAVDPKESREIASWWVAFYLVSMGPLYRETLHGLGHGAAVDEVVAANPTPRTFDVPAAAEHLLDELTLWGDADKARSSLEDWYAAGAEMPMLTLPPGRDLETLDYMLESLRPT